MDGPATILVVDDDPSMRTILSSDSPIRCESRWWMWNTIADNMRPALAVTAQILMRMLRGAVQTALPTRAGHPFWRRQDSWHVADAYRISELVP